MDIHIAAYRSRIGSFNTSRQISYIPENSRNPSYKSSKTSTSKFGRVRAAFVCCPLSEMVLPEWLKFNAYDFVRVLIIYYLKTN